MKSSIIAVAFMLVGCQTAAVMQEPDRTGFYKECLNADILLQTCTCMEEAAVKTTGYTRPLHDFGVPSAEMDAFAAALTASYASCSEKTMKQLEAANDKTEKR